MGGSRCSLAEGPGPKAKGKRNGGGPARVLSPDSPTWCSAQSACHGCRLRAKQGGPVRRHPRRCILKRTLKETLASDSRFLSLNLCFPFCLPPFAACLCHAHPPHLSKLQYTSPSHRDPLGREQRRFELRVRAVAADPAVGGDDAVIGEPRCLGGPHEIADGARRAWFARQLRDIAVGGDAAGRNAADDDHDASRESRHDDQRTTASLNTRPFVWVSVTPVSDASVGTMSTGLAA